MKDVIKELLERAAANLLAHQPNLFSFTSQTGQTEWNISHHLANEIHRIYPKYDCDLDVVKRNYKDKRPDVILHERGNNERNFLVIEVKRKAGAVRIASDIKKIKEEWFRAPLCYKYGAMIVFRGEKVDVEVFENTGLQITK